MTHRQSIRALPFALCLCTLPGFLTPALSAKAAPAQTEDALWDRVRPIVSRYVGEWHDESYPGALDGHVPATALLGNGDLGVSSAGSPGVKTFIVSKSDFWGWHDYPLTVGGVTVTGIASDASARKPKPKPADVAWPADLGLTLAGTAASSCFSPARFAGDRSFGSTYRPGTDYEGWVSDTQDKDAAPWIQYRWKQPVRLGAWRMVCDGEARGPANAKNNPAAFTVAYSSDGKTWTVADRIVGNTRGQLVRNLPENVTASYIRFTFTQPEQSRRKDARARVNHVAFYGQALEYADPPAPAFCEKQNIADATVTTDITLKGVPLSMKTWVAANDSLFVTEIASRSETDTLTLQVSTWTRDADRSYPAKIAEKDGRRYVMRQTAKRPTCPTRTPPDTGPLSDGTTPYVSEVAMATRIVGAAPDRTETSGMRILQQVTLKPRQTLYLVTAVGGGGRVYKTADMRPWDPEAPLPLDRAAALMKRCTSEADVKRLDRERIRRWKTFWCKSFVEFDTDDPKLDTVLRYCYGSLYMQASALRPDGIAAGLYGIWHVTDTATWSSDYHMNYNFYASYISLPPCSRAEYTIPAMKALFDFVPTAKYNAGRTETIREIFPRDRRYLLERFIKEGRIDPVRGVPDALLTPAATGPFGQMLAWHYLNEFMNAAYNCFPIIEYYEYTLDDTYLKSHGYDYIKASIRLYDALLMRKDLPDGGYVYELQAGANEGSWSVNPAVELQALKTALSCLIRYSRLLGRDAGLRDRWIEQYTHLPAQPTVVVNGKKVLNLAEEGGRVDARGNVSQDWHRFVNPVKDSFLNIIPMDAMLPGNLYNRYSPPEDIELLQNTLRLYGSSYHVDDGIPMNGWRQNNNFPRIYTQAVKSRMDPRFVIDSLVTVLNQIMRENMTCADRWHVFEKTGNVNSINEMLLNSDAGLIAVFPNWLKDKDARFTGLAAKGAFRIDAAYDGKAQKTTALKITSGKGSRCRLVSPWKNGLTVTDANGRNIPVTVGKVPYYSPMSLIDENHRPTGYYDEDVCTFDTTPGMTYTVTEKPAPQP